MHTSSKSLLLVLATFVVAAGVSITFWALGNPLAIDRTGTAGDGSEGGSVTLLDLVSPQSEEYRELLDCIIPSDASQFSKNKRTGYVFLYVRDCDEATVTELMATGRVDYTAREDMFGMTLLHNAAANTDYPGVINLFLNKNIPIEARAGVNIASRGATPLGTAIETKNVEATRVLLNAGADPTASYETWDSLVSACREWTESENEHFRDQPACEVLYEWLDK